MRTETEVDNREVLAIWLKEGIKHMTTTQSAFTTAVRKSGLGRNQEKRDFLAPSSTDTFITKNVNNTRQSCTAVFLDMLPQDLMTELKAGKHLVVFFIGFANVTSLLLHHVVLVSKNVLVLACFCSDKTGETHNHWPRAASQQGSVGGSSHRSRWQAVWRTTANAEWGRGDAGPRATSRPGGAR